MAEGLIASTTLSPAERAEVYHICSVSWHRLGNLFKAIPQEDKALATAIEADDLAIASKALSNLVGMHVEAGDWGRAIELGEQFLRHPDPPYLSYVHHNLGHAHQARHDREKMLYHYRQAVAVADEQGAPTSFRVQMHQQLAWQLLLLDRITEADQQIEMAKALIGDEDADGKREQILLGALRAYQTGDIEGAAALAEEIIHRGAPAIDDQRRQLAWANLVCGWVARDWSKLDQAERFAKVALELALQLQWPEGMKRANRLLLETNDKREAAG